MSLLLQQAAAAARAYREGDFAAAARGFEALVEAGAGSADVWTNLGNAHFHAGELGKAAWAWENALRTRPGDEAVRAQLAGLRADAEGVQVVPGSAFHRIGARLDPGVAADLLLGGWILACGLLLVRTQLGTGWRRGLAGALAAFSLVVALFGGAGLLLVEADRRAGWAVVVDPVVARAAPHEEAEVLARLGAGSRVRILRQEGGWSFLLLGEEARGWAPAAQVRAILP